MAEEEHGLAGLPFGNAFDEQIHVVEIFVEAADQYAIAVRAAMAAKVHRIDGIAAAVQLVGQFRIAAAVLRDAMDHDDRCLRFAVRQPKLFIQAQAIACGEAVFVVRHRLLSYCYNANVVGCVKRTTHCSLLWLVRFTHPTAGLLSLNGNF